MEHPRIGVDLRQVAATGIGDEYDHDIAGAAIACDGQRRVHGGSARAADQQTLVARDAPRGEEGVGVAHLDNPIDDGRIEGGRPEVLADSFGEIRTTGATGVHGTRRVGPDDLHVAILRLQEPPDTGNRPAGADARAEVSHAAVRLLPNLRTGGLLVRERVRGIRILVGPERARRLAHQSLGRRVVRARVFGRDGGRAHHHLGSIRAQQRDLLVTHLVAHHEDAAVAALRRHDRESRAGVPRGRLDDRAARLQESVALGRVDHRDRDAILDTAARIRRFELGDERALHAVRSRDSRQAYERGATDEMENRIGGVDRRHVGHERDATSGRAGDRANASFPCSPAGPLAPVKRNA